MNARNTTAAPTAPPPGYRLHSSVDLKRDRKVATAIQVVAVLIAAAMVGLALLLDLPFASNWSTGLTIAVTVAACLVYMAVHELTHGAILWLLTGVRPTIALRFPYLTTGSQGHLGRRSFVVVALAPAVLWGASLLVTLLVVPPQLLLATYVVTALNLAGSSGDYFQAYAVARLPRTALIRDDGKATTVFLPEP
jgi:Putative zincin peptidase